MRGILKGLGLILLLALGALVYSFTPATLPTADAPSITLPPPAQPPAAMTLAVMQAGKMKSQNFFAYRGGNFAETTFGMAGILVRHPKGILLFDAGFGSAVAEHIKTMPKLMQWTTRYEQEPTVAAQLHAHGIEPTALTAIIPTHAHWDHVSGIADLPGAPVWLSEAEAAFVASEAPMAALGHQLIHQPVVYRFDGGPYLGFAQSKDVFGDGSVVLVPAPGHTPGSILAFIHTPDGKHYALLGDTVWATEGVSLPAERPWLPRHLVDGDAEAVRKLIVHLHAIQQAMPALLMVPAHDRRVLEQLPPLR